ncbi:hypothetical protein JTE90_020508 [Oedothorax gibbosus]|uniref:Uncharacterized protein n=1 Tax=Oedothorax gibbosus TaxID=931172 RepID=A0AAV6UTB2_9ARAC|nr:hypothetical protein JTE90_020508 [Oedothorax gibbosus]
MEDFGSRILDFPKLKGSAPARTSRLGSARANPWHFARIGQLGSAGDNPRHFHLFQPGPDRPTGVIYWGQQAPTSGPYAYSSQDRSTGVSRRQRLALPPSPSRTGLLGSSTGVSRLQPQVLMPIPARTGLLGSVGANPWHFRLLRPGPVYRGQQGPTPGTSSSCGQNRSTGVTRLQPQQLLPPPARTGLLGSAGANPWHFLLLRPGLVYWGQQATTPCTSSSSSQDRSTGVRWNQLLALPPPPTRTGLLGAPCANPCYFCLLRPGPVYRGHLLWSPGSNSRHFCLFQPGPVYWCQQAPTPGTSSSSGQDWSTGVIRRQPLSLPLAPARTGLQGSAGAKPWHFRLLRPGPVYWGHLLWSPGSNSRPFCLFQPGPVYWCQQAPTPGTSSSSGQDWSTGVIRRQPLSLPLAPARTGLQGSAGAKPWHFRLLRPGPVYWGQRRQPLALTPPPARTGLLGSAGATDGTSASSGQDWSTGVCKRQPLGTSAFSVQDRSSGVSWLCQGSSALPEEADDLICLLRLGRPPPPSSGNPWHFLLLRPGSVSWGQQATTPGIFACSGQDQSTGVSRANSRHFLLLRPEPVYWGHQAPTPATSASSDQDWSTGGSRRQPLQDRSTGVSRRQPLALPPPPARTGLLGSSGAKPWHFRLLQPGPVYWGQRRQPLALPPPPARTGLLGSARANPWHFLLLRPGLVYWGQQAQPMALPPPPARTGLPGSAGANPWHFLLLLPGLVYWGQQGPTPGTSASSGRDRSTGVRGDNPWHFLLLRPGPVYWGLQTPTPGTSAFSVQDQSSGVSWLCQGSSALPEEADDLICLLRLGRPPLATPGTSSFSGQDRSTGVSRRQPQALPSLPARTGLLGSAGANP